jgi:hypothetical protein
MPEVAYSNNSSEKDTVRDNWIEFSKDMFEGDEFKLLTMPSYEMQDIFLYAEKGLIKLVKTETGNYKLTKGKLVCYEMVKEKWDIIKTKIVCESIFCTTIYHGLTSGEYRKTFPFDTINLDFDGELEKSVRNPKHLFDAIFTNQALYKKDFAFFLTFPETVANFTGPYKNNLVEIIRTNLSERDNHVFIAKYNSLYNSEIEHIANEEFCKISISKEIIKSAHHHNYRLKKAKFFTYGNRTGREPRQRMISLLYSFKFDQNRLPHSDYLTDVVYALETLNDLTG